MVKSSLPSSGSLLGGGDSQGEPFDPLQSVELKSFKTVLIAALASVKRVYRTCRRFWSMTSDFEGPHSKISAMGPEFMEA